MKVCSGCGSEIKDEAKFCPYCGQKQEEAPAEVTSDVEDKAQEEFETVYEDVKETAKKHEAAAKPMMEADDDAFETVYEEAGEEFETVYEAAKPKKPRSGRPAPAAEEDFDYAEEEEYAPRAPRTAPQFDFKAAIDKCYHVLTGNDGSPKIWQLCVCGVSVLAAILFLISACIGSAFSLAGIPASLFLGYFALKKPRFNTVGMLIPILLFALMLVSMGATTHGMIDVSYDAETNDSMSNREYQDASAEHAERFTDTEALQEKSDKMYDKYDSYTDYMVDFVGDTLFAGLKADMMIFRVLFFLMCVAYVLVLTGKFRNVNASMYTILAMSAACMVYYVIKMFGSYGGGMVLHYLAAFFFMACWCAFVFCSDKMSENKKTRVMHRFFGLTATPYQLTGVTMAVQIAAFVIAGVLALVAVYILVLTILVLANLAEEDLAIYFVRYALNSLTHIAMFICGAFMAFRLAQKISHRDDSFLKHYLILGCYCVGMVFMVCSTPVISGWGLLGLTAAAFALVAGSAIFLAKSSGIYDYFGNDKYVTQCSLLKWLR